MSIYSVFDKKAVSFSPLFIAQNDEVAKRMVSVSLLDDTMLSHSPSDFALYHLGEFDTNTGNVSGISPVNIVCEVLSLIEIDNKESN